LKIGRILVEEHWHYRYHKKLDHFSRANGLEGESNEKKADHGKQNGTDALPTLTSACAYECIV
jgi:hypothetical protein